MKQHFKNKDWTKISRFFHKFIQKGLKKREWGNEGKTEGVKGEGGKKEGNKYKKLTTIANMI